MFVLATNLMTEPAWRARCVLYRQALVKDDKIQAALKRLRTLTDLETRAMSAETRATVSGILAITAETRGAVETMKTGLFEFLQVEKEDRAWQNKLRMLGRVESAEIDAQRPDGCMEGTRVGVLEDLRAWSRDPHAHRIYWLNGMAGTGKSAIARSFCHILRQDDLLGGSFFCSRGGSDGDRDANRILYTLAASLASRSAWFKDSLASELERVPFSAKWNLQLQIEHLFKSPLSRVDTDSKPMTVLVIDALDECSSVTSTYDLLSLLIHVAGSLPVKFLLTSRPEPHIRRQLERMDTGLGRVLRLHDIDQEVVGADILTFLTRGFRAIKDASLSTCVSTWPHQKDIDIVAKLSGKLFIYAFTVLKYVQQRDPISRLARITDPNVTAGHALTRPLDDIYNLVLSEAMDTELYDTDEIELTEHILVAILTVKQLLSVSRLADLFGMPPNRIKASLDRLYAVVYVPVHDDTASLSMFHASFGDFLTAPGRAPPYIPKYALRHSLLATLCIRKMQSLEFYMRIPSSSSL
ncbi:hypothetical protein PENSPDRAFT_704841, partial [Peniophora sp. CONT]